MTRTPGSGLPGYGVVLLALLAGLGGAAYDLLTGPALGLVFAVCFVVGCALAALLVRREALGVAAVQPPLVYVVVAVVSGSVNGSSAAGSVLVRSGLELFTALVLQAPALMAATAAALLVALLRRLTRRRPAAEASAPQDQREPLVY